ncbi:MAG: endonuclease MutS2 [Oscillospiraceae bacterium]|nr:endonuclease MutS2 [Oscillospiraceae bacterium]
MKELNEKSLKTIELPAVLELLAAICSSEGAREAALALRPSADVRQVRERLAETTDAKRMVETKGSPSFSGLKDVRSNLARADLGGMLNTRELLDIAGVLFCARSLSSYSSGKGESGTLGRLFASLAPNRFLEEKITSAITGEEEIADSASPELADIRRKMRAASARVRDSLQKIITSPSYAKVLQEAIITQRGGRFVVPVRAEKRGELPGLVHDVSSSGSTLFVEPMGVVKANNELRELGVREKAEIERILMELSAECAAARGNIDLDYNVLTALDLIFAKSELSYRMNGGEPLLTENEIVLKKARHPLLPRDTAVPIDLTLGGEGHDTVVITGPNTGGKTVTLKTLGLLCAMAGCGLHIPAGDGSAVPVLESILADIGDEQSIEQSLSTFSSHMVNMVDILRQCGAGSLVLLDEVGAGTDPTEGAALAISIIEYARKAGALLAATTHYAELKIYATNTPGVVNASCEFDVETLRPTYRLLVGIPGKSNAFAISSRLGLPDTIIEDAKRRLSAESSTFEKTIERLEAQRIAMEKQMDAQERAKRAAEEDAKQAERMRRELEVRLEKAELKAKREAERILQEAREAADEAWREIDRERAAANEELDHQQINEARAAMRRRLNEAEERFREPDAAFRTPAEKPSRPLRAGDTVELLSSGIRAEILKINDNGSLYLQAGIMKVTASPEEVRLVENAGKKKQGAAGSGSGLRTASCAPELDIRGMMPDEADLVVERYLDNAYRAKLKTVTIIHGKGTGALRAAVQQMLRRNRLVKNYRLGRYGEGETGVTVVELK